MAAVAVKGSDAVKKFIGSDIDIAQAVYPEHACDVKEIAAKLDIPDKYIEQYGRYKAKIDYNYLNNELKDKKDGKLILVTAITPTPAGCTYPRSGTVPQEWRREWSCR